MLSPCEPPTAALDVTERPESAGEIEIPALSGEAEVNVSHTPEPERSSAPPEVSAENTAGDEQTDGKAEETGQEKDEV
jgi:hypothetical protein